MTPEEMKAAEIDRMLKAERRADADVGTKLDKLLSCLDGMSERMDAVEASEKKRRDAIKLKKDNAEDEDGAEDEDDDREFGEARRLAADADNSYGHPMKNDLRNQDQDYGHDRQLRADSIKAEAQIRADACASQFGRSAPKPMDGETVRNYRVRLLRPYQHNCAEFKELSTAELRRLPDKTFNAVERRIYADATQASSSPSVAKGYLQMVKKQDETGRTHIIWHGEPRVWLSQFSHPTRRVAAFHTPGWSK
jgi:hypothetical protein